MDKIELIEDVKNAIDQISSGKGIIHSKARQMLKARYSK
jgi:hypothetical protein